MNNNEIFAKALQTALDGDIQEYQKLSDHRFSRNFTRKMKSLIYAKPPAFSLGNTRVQLRKSVACAILAIIMAALLTGATFAAYKLWEHYRIEDHGLYSLLNITDIDNAPTAIEERYRLGADFSGYTENILSDDEVMYFVEYENPTENKTLCFSQYTKDNAQNVMLNTENAIMLPTEVLINQNQGIIFITYQNSTAIIWSFDNYLFEIVANGFKQNELISIAETVKKVE